MFFFFFQQKTAYEMRISDWSSDVCSSDLACRTRASRLAHPSADVRGLAAPWLRSLTVRIAAGRDSWQALAVGWDRGGDQRGDANTPRFLRRARGPRRSCATWTQAGPLRPRSRSTAPPHRADRQSVVSGKSVSVRVVLGGPRLIKTKNISYVSSQSSW